MPSDSYNFCKNENKSLEEEKYDSNFRDETELGALS